MKINFNRIRNIFSRLPRFLAEHDFLLFLGLICLVLLFIGFLLYRYYHISKKAERQSLEPSIQIEQEPLQDVLQAWQLRERKFEQADWQTYIDPFF